MEEEEVEEEEEEETQAKASKEEAEAAHSMFDQNKHSVLNPLAAKHTPAQHTGVAHCTPDTSCVFPRSQTEYWF